MLHRMRGFISHQLLRLLFRLGIEKRIIGAASADPHLVHDRAVEQIRHLPDSELDAMVAELGKGQLSEEARRLVDMLGSAGIGVVQEVRNEKFLRDHRKKYGKVSE